MMIKLIINIKVNKQNKFLKWKKLLKKKEDYDKLSKSAAKIQVKLFENGKLIDDLSIKVDYFSSQYRTLDKQNKQIKQDLENNEKISENTNKRNEKFSENLKKKENDIKDVQKNQFVCVK